MKKLMFALGAAALCSTVFADVTSANIVGYGPSVLPNSGISIGPSFVSISGEKIDLCDIKVVGYEAEGATPGDVQVQTLTAGGGTDRTFIFFDVPEEDFGPGWFDADNDYEPLEPGDITLGVGEGLWSITTADGLSLQTAGEVATVNDVVSPLPNSGLTIVNPTPVAVDLINCYVTGYEGEEGDGATAGDVQVQTLTAGGGTDRTFIFFDVPEEDFGPGWFDPDNDYEPLEEGSVVCQPGQGLWSITTADNLFFCWPKVEIK